jgi:D-alanyl-D-alanine carboxypeptidase/D-alanyl-D-alanine-endopeptidase (penicillin-binding protein 4)
MASTLLALALQPVAARAQTLPAPLLSRLKGWYRFASRSAPGTWGIAIANQEGEILWSVRPDRAMIPASTVKLLTTGFARTVLGGDARRSTRVIADGHLDESTGEWLGRWSLEVNGDPSLENPAGDGPRLENLATQLTAVGVRRLRGPLELTSTNGPADAAYPAAWSPGNRRSILAPKVGPVTLHENVIWLDLRPGPKIGSRARLAETAPDGIDALVDVHATTGGGWRSRLRVSPMKDGGYLVTGSIGIHAATRRLVAVAADPKAVLAAAWARALQGAGIEWDRRPVAQPIEGGTGQVLAEITSAPLDSLALDINRRSLNIGAELLLQWAGGREKGPELLTEHVQQVAGTSDDGVHLVDGSGMSHDDRVTPATFISYLANFPNTPAGRNFPMLLPANGVGTLARLAGGLPAPGVVHAKTGTLNGVSTLVGYLGRKDGVLLISLMYNGGRSRTAKRHQWTLFRLLGADGASIPADSTVEPDEGEATDSLDLGGDSLPPEN